MKAALMEAIRAELQSRLEVLMRAACEAHAAATDPGSKAEGKYDTRSLEASYLATGQAKQVDELSAALRTFESYRPEDFGFDDAVDAGALVEVELAGECSWFLLAPTGGGISVVLEGTEVTVLAPGSLLYQNLLGMQVGETRENPRRTVLELI